MSSSNSRTNESFSLTRPFAVPRFNSRNPLRRSNSSSHGMSSPRAEEIPSPRGRRGSATQAAAAPVRCINPASDVNSRLDTQVEVKVYPCNNSQSSGKKKFTSFTIKPEVSCLLLVVCAHCGDGGAVVQCDAVRCSIAPIRQLNKQSICVHVRIPIHGV